MTVVIVDSNLKKERGAERKENALTLGVRIRPSSRLIDSTWEVLSFLALNSSSVILSLHC
jgi:hypothetical protein